MKIVSIIGARPQIIKGAAISRAIRNHFSDQIQEVIVHTGQHYDENMSAVFFGELNIPEPNYNLGVGSASHAVQTARMLEGVEDILLKEEPNAVLVYGDTNSTLAAGIVTSKMNIPLIHIEAGLRSYNKSMPEEVNRIVCDHVSSLLFSPTVQGINNLKKEGFRSENEAPYHIDNPRIYHCGDVMYDNSLYFADLVSERPFPVDIEPSSDFILATVHRNANTDDSERLINIFETLVELSEFNELPIVLPLHPRTAKMMDQFFDEELKQKISASKLLIINPVSFLDMIQLEKSASLIITDSGGVQKEAFFFQKPALILRPETEWVEIVDNGNAVLCDASREKILKGFEKLYKAENLTFPPFYGDGKAAEFICSEILKQLG